MMRSEFVIHVGVWVWSIYLLFVTSALMGRSTCSLLESTSSEASNLKSKEQQAKDCCWQKQKDEKNPAVHDDRRGTGHRTVASSMPISSVISWESNATCSGVLLDNAFELHYPEMCLLASDSGVTAHKSEIETISSGETLFFGPSSSNLNACRSRGQLNHRLQPSSHNSREDPNCPNQKNKIKCPQAKHPQKAASAKSIHELCAGLVFDERSYFRDLAQVVSTILSWVLSAQRSITYGMREL